MKRARRAKRWKRTKSLARVLPDLHVFRDELVKHYEALTGRPVKLRPEFRVKRLPSFLQERWSVVGRELEASRLGWLKQIGDQVLQGEVSVDDLLAR